MAQVPKIGRVVHGTTTLQGLAAGLGGTTDPDAGASVSVENYAYRGSRALTATAVDATFTFPSGADACIVVRNITDAGILYIEPDAATDADSMQVVIGGSHPFNKRGMSTFHYSTDGGNIGFILEYYWN